MSKPVLASRGDMEIGSVKWFNNAKGWGFISNASGEDIFVHYSEIKGDGYRKLRQGDRVEYELRDGPRGRFAENVRLFACVEPEASRVRLESHVFV